MGLKSETQVCQELSSCVALGKQYKSSEPRFSQLDRTTTPLQGSFKGIVHWAAVTNITDRGALTTDMYFQDQGVGRVVSTEASPLGLSMAVFSLGLTCSSLCVCLCPDLLFLKRASHTGSGPQLRTAFNLLTSLKTISKYSYILTCWELGLQHRNCGRGGRDTIQPIQVIIQNYNN